VSAPSPIVLLEIVALAGYLLGFAALPRVLLVRRESSATLSWVFAVAFVPWLGLLAYALFGSRRIRRIKRRRDRSSIRLRDDRARVAESALVAFGRPAPPDAGGGVLEPAMALADRISESPATSGNRVDLLLDGEPTFAALEAAIRAARHHVHLEYYIFAGDRTGARFRDLLADRAREGVQVRLLYDHAGSFSLPRDFLAPLAAAGGQVGVFLPVNLLARRFNPSLRNHRKIVVVDGTVGFTGGINIGDEYLAGSRRARLWRDTHARIEGPAVHRLQEVFAEDWHFATGENLVSRRFFPEQARAGDLVVQVLASGPDERWEVIHRILFTAIANAERSVLLTTPYLAPDQAMLVALETAALRGVDVKLLLPRRSDHRLLDYTARSFFTELLESGVRLFEYGPGIMHAKTAVIDRVWSTVGSANMDARSFRLNFEANLVIYGVEFARRLDEVIGKDLEVAREVHLEHFRRRSYRQRLIEGACRVLAPVL
jgi:cardiolipin synthase